MEEYAKEMEKLAYKLLELISLSLGLIGDKFHDCFKNQLSMVRLNHYPPCPFPHLALGVGRHKDSSALTILAQGDIEALQVKRKLVGDWISVKPIHGAFIINVGDIVQVCFLNKILQSSNLFFGGKEIAIFLKKMFRSLPNC
jgi:isopenicillin N synthase-like dioxygenase